MAGCCDHGNNSWGSIKGTEFLDQLKNCRLFKYIALNVALLLRVQEVLGPNLLKIIPPKFLST